MDTSKKTKIDVSKIPESDVKNLCSTFLDAIRRYYADTQNQEEFERWEREQMTQAK